MTGFQASLSPTNGTPWNKELPLSKQCDSKHLRQTRRCCSPSPWLTFGTALPQTSPLSEMAAISSCRRARGQAEWGRQRVRREETRASCRGPEWEEERWRARRSGIIRSLCGPLKRLRRKPADGTSALTHLGKGHIRDTHSIELCHTCGMVKRGETKKNDQQEK